MTAQASAQRFYRPELDVLRFGAFFAVFLHHSLPTTADSYRSMGLPEGLSQFLAQAVGAGGFGVDLFFVLSSYLITELLLRELDTAGRLDIRSFYARRALRIWPLYFTFLFASATLFPLVWPNDTLGPGYLAAFILLSGNWACAAWGYPPSAAAPLWSISIEEQFYLFWPVIVGWISRRVLPWALTSFFVVASLARLYLSLKETPHPGIWCNTLARLDPIAAGSLCALALRRVGPPKALPTRIALLISGITVCVAVAVLCDLEKTPSLTQVMIGYPAITTACVLMLFGTLAPSTARAAPPPWVPPLAALGRISYGLYVFHVLALRTARLVHWPGGKSVAFILTLATAFGLTVALAWASYRWLERPFLLLKDRFAVVPSRPVS